jgi:hypothetical protein
MKITLRHLIAIFILVAALMFTLPLVRKLCDSAGTGAASETADGFLDLSNISMKDYEYADRDKYIGIGQQRYNRFADTQDVMRPGFAGMTAQQIRETNRGLRDSMVAVDVPAAMTMTPIGPKQETTVLFPREAVQPPSAILKAAKYCEATLRTRDSCDLLDKPENKHCGVCIKGGTGLYAEEMKITPGTHIGGLLMVESDRLMAEQEGAEKNTAPVYQPTIGSCPPGYFFPKRDLCRKEANRQNCKESGETGGFKGVTIEGKRIAERDCANCYARGPESFIYQPADHKFMINVRVVTPAGTGRNIIRIFSGTSLVGEKRMMGGSEEIISLTNDVKEGDELKFIVYQEFPHRPRGRSELFYANRGPTETGRSEYTMNRDDANRLCQRMNATPATRKQMDESVDSGIQLCKVGHGSDFTGMPMQGERARCGTHGFNVSSQPEAGAWCYGVKPPVGRYFEQGMFDTVIEPFFFTYLNDIEPSQSNRATMTSQHGMNYVAPYYRGIILQFESAGGGTIRRHPIESAITTVNDMDPSSVTLEGLKSFRMLRRRGTYKASQLIVSPKPRSSGPSSVIVNQYWLWGHVTDSSVFKLTAKVPGIYSQAHYLEDNMVCPSGPIIKNPETFKLLRISPCAREGQVPGKYDQECMVNLFSSAGGDPNMGTLSPIYPEGMEAALFKSDGTPRTEDEIVEFYAYNYTVATSGRDPDGNAVGGDNRKKRREIINDAAMKMFGVTLVTPCEEVEEGHDGEIMLVSKRPPFDADCLDYLYMNAGTDRSRGNEEPTRKDITGATYTSIQDRYSGIRYGEVAAKSKREDHPFAACQRSGTLAPIRPDGSTNNMAVAEANAGKNNILDVQNYYNTIYKQANTSYTGMISDKKAEEQRLAFQKCYGIEKTEEEDAEGTADSLGCGVVARYVRVLRSQTGAALDPHKCNGGANSIQISQLMVFNKNNKEVARGKPTEASSHVPGNPPENAVDGRGPRKQFGDIFIDGDPTHGASNQYWMVDLEKSFEITRVEYYNRDHMDGGTWWKTPGPGEEPRTCTRNAQDMIIQLLDKNKNVLAMKNVTNAFAVKNTISFSYRDVERPLKLSNLVPGMRIRFQNAAKTNLFMIRTSPPDQGRLDWRGSDIGCETIDSSINNHMIDRSIFIFRYGNSPDTAMFESSEYPGRYIIDRYGALAYLPVPSNGDTTVFEWKITAALCGAPGYVSIVNARSTGLHWATGNQNQSVSDRVVHLPADLGTAVRCSWRIFPVSDN